MKQLTIGVDLGGTKIRIALVDADGNVHQSIRIPTDIKKGAKGIVADIVQCVKHDLKKSKKAEALGIGVAGQINTKKGIVHFAPNLGWEKVHLQSDLEKALDIPVIVTNDVRAATYGEWYYGAGKGYDDIICLFVGTGIGGGIVSGGQMLEGSTNEAGELGHTTIVVDGRKCHCHNLGCLEAYAGGWAIAERTRERVEQDPQAGKMLLSLAGDVENITADILAKAYTKHDKLSISIIKETGHYLASGIVGMVNALNPEVFIFGGGIMNGFTKLKGMVEEEVSLRALSSASKKLKFVLDELGHDAGAVGAAALARTRIGKHCGK
ncbi:MAG: ROK family protein [Candidatus Kapaibacterium sp.]|jgi:glucokinase